MQYIGRPLTSAEQLTLDACIKNYPGESIKSVTSFHTADFTDDEDTPGGLLMIHPVGAKVHVDSLPSNAFSYMAICPVLSNKDYSDADFKGKEALLHEAVPQFSKRPPTLQCRSIETQTDGKTWDAELGEDADAFAGVFKQTRGRDTRYFIVAQAGAPRASKQLRERIAKNSDMTFDQLLRDPMYNYCHYIAQRNAQRLAWNVARSLGVPIRHMADVGSHREAEYIALPKRAHAQYLQPTTTIDKMSNDTHHVGVFNKLTPVSHNASTNFVYEGPYNGIAVFNMHNRAIGAALPSHSGRLANPTKLDAKEVQKRVQNVICEGDIQVRNPRSVSRDLTPEDFDRWRNLTAPSGRSNSLAPVKSRSAGDSPVQTRRVSAYFTVRSISRSKTQIAHSRLYRCILT